MTFGVTDKGLVVKRLPDVITSLQQSAIQEYADIVDPQDEVDVSENTFLGRQISTFSASIADLWEQLQFVNDSYNPNAARGIAQDNLYLLSRITREAARPTTTSVLFDGDIGTVVNVGLKLQSSTTKRFFSVISGGQINQDDVSEIVFDITDPTDGMVYSVTRTNPIGTSVVATFTASVSDTIGDVLAALEASLSVGGYVCTVDGNTLAVASPDAFQTDTYTVSDTVTAITAKKLFEVSADVVGPFPQVAGSIDTVTTFVTGLASVANPEDAAVGRYKETDTEFRERFRNSRFAAGAGTYESILETISSLDGVSEVKIIPNESNITDVNGIPAHEFLVIVRGGSATAITKSIFQKKPIGIRSFGNTSAVIYDSTGNPWEIYFSRPVEVPVYISLTIEDVGGLPGDYEEQLKTQIYDYITANQKIGGTLVYSRLFTPINSVNGHSVVSMYVDTVPSPTATANISISFDQLITVNKYDIVVSVI